MHKSLGRPTKKQDQTMRVLIYGFKPFGSHAENISEQLLLQVPATGTLVKKVFDVRFDAEMFNKVLTKVKPDRILGLGLHPRARKLRIERKAINLRKNEDKTTMPISLTGPVSIYATLHLPETSLTTVTYNAGTYVCNYSMYLMGQYCAQTGAQFGFIHIPKDYDLKKLSAWLKTTLARIGVV